MSFPGGSDGKESTCSAGDLGSFPGSGKSPEEGNGYPLQYSCLENSVNREAWQAADHGVTIRHEQPILYYVYTHSPSFCSPGGGNGNPLQYSYLGNPMDRGAWWATVHRVARNWTRVSAHTLHAVYAWGGPKISR